MVSPTRRTQYSAYNTARQTTSKTRQVVMLYDGVIRFVQQAKHAIEEHRYEDRYKLLVKVSEIVVGLQSSLDFDNGGEVARQLYDFYTSVETQIMAIHRTNSMEMCDEIIESMKAMRDEWSRIDTLCEGKTANSDASPVYSDNTENTGDATTSSAVADEGGSGGVATKVPGNNDSQSIQISV